MGDPEELSRLEELARLVPPLSCIFADLIPSTNHNEGNCSRTGRSVR